MSQPRIFPVILAGGASSRLWPASGAEKPKWDLRLFSAASAGQKPQSLLEGAWERARAVAAAADCFVIAGAPQAALIRSSLPDLPEKNLLIEPEPRDTSGAVAFAAAGILKATGGKPDPNHVMFVLPGDHVISPIERFTRCALDGARVAVESSSLVTFGIVAKQPAIQYGYIQRGPELKLPSNVQAYRVLKFREKPDRATAESYVASGEYYWNGGIFLWQMTTLMAELERQLPDHANMAHALGGSSDPGWSALAREHFPKLKKISIDFGIMEGAKSVATIPADFNWDDIGSWSAVGPHLPKSAGNAVGPDTRLLQIDARNNIVFAPGKRVALIGVENIAVVESNGEILICRLDQDQNVKQISEQAKKLP
jgi:mannose-1-phosphate guanylyltransferase